MDTPLVEELKREEQTLLLRLAAVRAALDVYVMGQLRGEPAPAPTTTPLPANIPCLDDMRIRDAINLYLHWCRDNGRERTTLGELEKVLLSFRVVSVRGQPMMAMRYPWKTLTNTLGSPDNKDTWNVVMHSSDHFQRADTIELIAPRRKPVEG